MYVSVSTGEGASVSVMKAMACGLPVLSTLVGKTSERMHRYGAGKLVPIYKYDEWKIAIEEILENGLPRVLGRTIARDVYDWPHVARRFVNLYDSLSEQCFGQCEDPSCEGTGQGQGMQDGAQRAHPEGG